MFGHIAKWIKGYEVKPLPGVYAIRCTVNNKVYIGKSRMKGGIRQRLNNHKNDLRKNRHGNQYLQNAYNKYGEDTFVFSAIQYVDSEDKTVEEVEAEISRLEYHYTQYVPKTQQFNINEVAKDGGFIHAASTGQKMVQSKIANGYTVKCFAVDYDEQRLIKSFDTIVDAATFCNRDKGNIYAALSTNNPIAGYGWVTEDKVYYKNGEYLLKEPFVVATNCMYVEKYDLDGNYIATYNSQQVAASNNGLKSSMSISNAIINKSTAAGFYWREITAYERANIIFGRIAQTTRINIDDYIRQTKRVYKYDIITGNIISWYESMTEGANKNNSTQRNIYQSVITGNAAEGYGWCLDDNIEYKYGKPQILVNYAIQHYNGKFVGQYKKQTDTYPINVFISYTEASEKTKLHRTVIGKACSGKQHTAGGFYWREITHEEYLKYKRR